MDSHGTVLVTGGSGYIASFCIAELLRQNYTVRTTVRNLSKEQQVRNDIATLVDANDRLSFYQADLTRDDGWDEAAKGCDYVLHVASPLGFPLPKNPDDLIIPAREGTLRVLSASIRSGVKRVVMTSSVAAANPTKEQGERADESSWTDPDDANITAYEKSKTLAERAAWDLITKNSGTTTLATVNPSLVLGPVLGADFSDSLQIVYRLLAGTMPGLPNLGFCVVDVRDVAKLHVLAMTSDRAAGQRFIASGEHVWIKDMARILRAHLGENGAKIPTRSAPDWLIKFISIFWRDLRTMNLWLSRRRFYSSQKAQTLLGWHMRPMQETLLDTGKSLVASGLVG